MWRTSSKSNTRHNLFDVKRTISNIYEDFKYNNAKFFVLFFIKISDSIFFHWITVLNINVDFIFFCSCFGNSMTFSSFYLWPMVSVCNKIQLSAGEWYEVRLYSTQDLCTVIVRQMCMIRNGNCLISEHYTSKWWMLMR